MSEEEVTCEQVMRWLPSDVREALTMAMPPPMRGWMTAEEAANYSGRTVEIGTASEARTWHIPTDNWEAWPA